MFVKLNKLFKLKNLKKEAKLIISNYYDALETHINRVNVDTNGML